MDGEGWIWMDGERWIWMDGERWIWMDGERYTTLIMAHDKAIKSGKEHRQSYRGSKAFDRSCRPGGNCPWCERNRRIAELRLAAIARLRAE